jgi:hypothetical protein
MTTDSHAPARDHAQAGLLGVGSNADTRPGSGSAKRSEKATKAAVGDTPMQTLKVAPSVARVPIGSPRVYSVPASQLARDAARKARAEQERRERRDKRARGGGDSLFLRPLTPAGERPNWGKARMHPLDQRLRAVKGWVRHKATPEQLRPHKKARPVAAQLGSRKKAKQRLARHRRVTVDSRYDTDAQ